MSGEQVSYVFEEFLGDDTGPGVNGQFHLADLLVDLLHEVDDKVHQLVFVHLLRVEVGNQEANVISLKSECERKETKIPVNKADKNTTFNSRLFFLITYKTYFIIWALILQKSLHTEHLLRHLFYIAVKFIS